MNRIATPKGLSLNQIVIRFLTRLFERPDEHSLKYYHRKKRAEDTLKSL